MGRFLVAAFGVWVIGVSSLAIALSPNTDWEHHPIGGVLVIVIPILVALDWARRFIKPN